MRQPGLLPYWIAPTEITYFEFIKRVLILMDGLQISGVFVRN